MFRHVMLKALARLTPPSDLAAPLEELVERARGYAADRRATTTRREYLSDFAGFEAWCARQALLAMPAAPATIAVYLSALADSAGGSRPSSVPSAALVTRTAHAAMSGRARTRRSPR
jgi:hypothetical protein